MGKFTSPSRLPSHPPITAILLHTVTVLKILRENNVRISKELSIRQITFLLYLSKFPKSTTIQRGVLLHECDLTARMIHYLLNCLINSGFISRLKPGHYSLSPSGHALVNEITSRYNDLMKRPYLFR